MEEAKKLLIENAQLSKELETLKVRSDFEQSQNLKQDLLKKKIVQLVSALSEWGIPVPPVNPDVQLSEEDSLLDFETEDEESLMEIKKENEEISQQNKILSEENRKIREENEKIQKQIDDVHSQAMSILTHLKFVVDEKMNKIEVFGSNIATTTTITTTTNLNSMNNTSNQDRTSVNTT
eukprot:TRINITY_DN751_c0_g3_i3.p1 TRINITY_DN751_c0_g3~~TRINITY_DN751_c0_g3_i3.p1  ORF type:complete len:179 (-),score=47.81 TRINITY_DN751_c0_g3_i3:101-637(-)